MLKTELTGSLYSLLNALNVIHVADGIRGWKLVSRGPRDPKYIIFELLLAVLKMDRDPKFDIQERMRAINPGLQFTDTFLLQY